MDLTNALLLESKIKYKEASSVQSSITWLLERGYNNYVNSITENKLPISLSEVLKSNNYKNGDDLLLLFGHVETLNESLSKTNPNTDVLHQSSWVAKTEWKPASPITECTTKRSSCHVDSGSKSCSTCSDAHWLHMSSLKHSTIDRSHTFTSFSAMNHRDTQFSIACQNDKQNQHSTNKISHKVEWKTESKYSNKTADDSTNIIGCTKHRNLTTVREQSVNDEITESTNHNWNINQHSSLIISSFPDSNSFSALGSKTKPEKIVDLSQHYLDSEQFNPNDKHLNKLALSNMKSHHHFSTVPEISVATHNLDTTHSSPDSAAKSIDSDFLLPTINNVNLRVSNDIPRSTGSNRRYFNSWGYDFELDSGVEELSNDSIDMGEAGRINFRTGSFMTRYRRNSKLSNNTSSPRPGLISPSQHCMNWGWCKDDSSHSMYDNVDDELNPVLDSLFSDMDSLDNFRNILQSRRISNNFEDFNPKDSSKKDLRPKDFNVRKSVNLKINKSSLDEKNEDVINSENVINQNNNVSRLNNENKFKKSSLKKSASARKRNHPFRWSSLARTNQPLNACHDMDLSHLSLNQFYIIKKLAILRLTSILESHIPTNKSQFNWKFPKLLSQKPKFSETSSDVFGASLTFWQSKIGQPLPPVIYHALKYIRQVGPESDGIFRRAGGKARINELKKEIEKNPDITDFSRWQPYDVADMIKSYFRSLPECLMTNKLSNTLISIKTYIPEQNWFEAIQWVIINLPDENRLVLQSLLYFLADLTKHSKTTQMTSHNLAVCLSPSLFHSPHVINSSSVSPIRMKKSTHGPDLRDLEDQKATHHCFKFMIDHAPLLFRLTEDTISKAKIQMEFEGITLLSKLFSDRNDWSSWIRSRVDELMNEYHHKFKSWTSVRKDILKIHSNKIDFYHGFELFYKKNIASSDKSNEGLNTICTWRITAEFDTNVSNLLEKIRYKRHEWDPEIETLHIKREISDSVDICYMEVASTPPQTKRRINLVRGCQQNIDGHINILLTQSVEDNKRMSDKKLSLEDRETEYDKNVINVIQDDVIIEYLPTTQKSRINWLSRVDLRGYSTEWYFRQWSHVLIRRLINLKIACAQIKI